MSERTPDTTLLVISPGQRELREWHLSRLRAEHRLVLLTTRPLTWEAPYVDDHVRIRPGDTAGVLDAAADLARRHRLGGVLTYHEPCVPLVPQIAEKLGLPHGNLGGIQHTRDKHATRTALAAAGVPSARSVLVESLADTRRAAAEIGFPGVVKPRSLAASTGVSKAVDDAALPAAWERACAGRLSEPWAHDPGVLVEEFLSGDEISVDSALLDGRRTSLVYARKFLSREPYFEEVGHIAGVPELIVDDVAEIETLLDEAHLALGLGSAVTHTEIRLTGTGPRIIEVNGRSGGGLIARIGLLATGTDVVAAEGAIATGQTYRPPPAPPPDRVVGVRFLYPARTGTVARIGYRDGFDVPGWTLDTGWFAGTGARVDASEPMTYLARIGYAIVEAAEVASCADRMERLAANVVCQTE